MTAKAKNVHTILLRPTWGRISLNPEASLSLTSYICQKAEEFQREGGRFFVISHSPEQELTAHFILSLVLVELRHRGRVARLLIPQVESDYPSETLSDEFLLLPNLPQHIGIIDWLRENKEKQLVITTATKSQWELVSVDLPYQYCQDFFPNQSDINGHLEDTLKLERQKYDSLNSLSQEIYKRVLVSDAVGTPIPVDLLINSFNDEPKQVFDSIVDLEENGLLFWIEADRSPALLISTKSVLVAHKMLEQMGLSDVAVLKNQAALINAVAGENKDERYAVLNFFQSASSGFGFFKRSELRNLIKRFSSKIEEIYREGDAIEHLLWGKVFEDLQLFEQSEKVFKDGLNKAPQNPYLHQAYAVMLGKRAQTVEQFERARKAFRELVNLNAENPYFWQARGVFETDHDTAQARRYFKKALQVATGAETKNYALVALANLEIEKARFEEAERLLKQTETSFQTPYIPHTWTKLYFSRGDFELGAEKLQEVFAINRYSVEGWNLLGEMTSKRAHWTAARTALEKAIAISSENVPTLRALADLETDIARVATEENNAEKASEHFSRAADFLERALDAEPDNLYCEVSRAVLLRYKGNASESEQDETMFQTAEQNLKKLFERYPDNEFISHNLGELYLAWRKAEQAQAYFNFLYKRNEKHIPTLIGLAKTEVELENREEGIDYLNKAERALGKAPLTLNEQVRVYNSLAEVWLQLNDLERANDLIETSLRLDNENGFTLLLYAKILRRMGRRNEEAEKIKAQTEELSLRELTGFPIGNLNDVD